MRGCVYVSVHRGGRRHQKIRRNVSFPFFFIGKDLDRDDDDHGDADDSRSDRLRLENRGCFDDEGTLFLEWREILLAQTRYEVLLRGGLDPPRHTSWRTTLLGLSETSSLTFSGVLLADNGTTLERLRRTTQGVNPARLFV